MTKAGMWHTWEVEKCL